MENTKKMRMTSDICFALMDARNHAGITDKALEAKIDGMLGYTDDMTPIIMTDADLLRRIIHDSADRAKTTLEGCDDDFRSAPMYRLVESMCESCINAGASIDAIIDSVLAH